MAVRSSALAEDGAEASFAGIFDSHLNIGDADGLLHAIRACWLSQWSETALAYGERMGTSGHTMGVLVQRLVSPTASGVLFTADPVTGDRSRLVVNAVYGLASELVEGTAPCDTFVVDRETGTVLDRKIADKPSAVVPGGPGEIVDLEVAAGRRQAPALTDAELRRLVELAAEIEAVRGDNQDIEWAFHDDELFALQARPITGLPSDLSAQYSPDLPPDGRYWLRASELSLGPSSVWGLISFGKFTEGLNRARASWHSPCRLRTATYQGYLYMGEDLATGDLPDDHQVAYEVAIDRMVAEAPVRWRDGWREAVQRSSREILAADLTARSDADLVGGLTAWLAGRADDDEIGGMVGMTPVFVMARLARMEPEIAQELAKHVLHGLPSMLGELEEALWLLVRELEADDWTRRTLTGLEAPAALEALRTRPEAWAPIAAFLGEYGYHGMDGIESTPWMEDTVPLIAVLAAKVGHEEERPSTRLARLAVERRHAVDALVAEHPGRAEAIRRLVVELESCLPLGQDRYVALTEVGHAATRYQLLEIGRRLCARDLLREPVDALYLDASELEQGLIGGLDRRGLVAERKRIRHWQRGLRPPITIGAEQSLDAVPYVIDSILSDRASGLDFSVGPGSADGEQVLVSGVAGSAGRYVGPARVCASVADAVRLRRGDILVCSTTSPAWTQYFGLIGAVVTDQGGLLSHPAVVAREYGIPAVIGAEGATTTIVSGQSVGVDGGSGIVFTPGSP